MNRNKQILKRKTRIRSKIKGTQDRPRLSVFKSNRFVYAQLIDDEKGQTLVGVSEKHLEKNPPAGGGKNANAKALGVLLAKEALSRKVKKAVFDKGSYAYHGRISNIAQGAREGGLDL